jgi:hypothetical protein
MIFTNHFWGKLQVLFIKSMIFLPHELLESPMDSFLATFAAPSRNREWQCHNSIHSAEVRYFTHRLPHPCVRGCKSHSHFRGHGAFSPNFFDISHIVAGEPATHPTRVEPPAVGRLQERSHPKLPDSWSPTGEVTPQLPSLGDMPSRWNYFSSALPTQGHVVNAVTTALELKKAFVVKPYDYIPCSGTPSKAWLPPTMVPTTSHKIREGKWSIGSFEVHSLYKTYFLWCRW